MKLDRFTRICINFVLILIIALLVKSLITIPKDVYAKEKAEYNVINYSRVGINSTNLEEYLNHYVDEGWRLHSIEAIKWGVIILER